MKRVISFILCGVMVLSLCAMTGCNKKKDVQKVLGTGKWYMTSRATYDEEGILDNRWEGDYNMDGQLVRYIVSFPDGVFNNYGGFATDYGIFVYDDAGRLEQSLDPNGNLRRRMYYDAAGVLRLQDDDYFKGRSEYNEKGNLWRQFTYDDDTLYLTAESTFDKDGNVIKTTYYSEYAQDEAKPVTEKQKTFGENLAFASQYTRSDKVVSISEYTYDKAGRNLTKTSMKADGTVTSKTEYTYDEQGREETVTVRENNTVTRRENTYSVTGNLIQYADYKNDQLQVTHEFTYDADNRQIDERLVLPDGSTMIVETCEYDENGNLVKRVSYTSGGEIKSTDVMTYTFIKGATAEPVVE